jgi:hypothetical protein
MVASSNALAGARAVIRRSTEGTNVEIGMGMFTSFKGGGVAEETDGCGVRSLDNLFVKTFRKCLFSVWRRCFLAFRELVLALTDETDGRELGARRAIGFSEGSGETIGREVPVSKVGLKPTASKGLRTLLEKRMILLDPLL